MNERQRLLEPETGRLRWAVTPWIQPLWYAYLAYCWWQVGAAEAERIGMQDSAAARSFEGVAVPAGKLVVLSIEAAFYRLWWRSRGRTLPFWRFFCLVASASLADVLAIRLAETASATPSLEAWLAPLAGVHVMGDHVLGSPSVRAAFGTFGILTLTRIGLTAHAQAQALGIRAREAWGWTALVWLLGRLALLWMVDLARGLSPLPAR